VTTGDDDATTLREQPSDVLGYCGMLLAAPDDGDLGRAHAAMVVPRQSIPSMACGGAVSTEGTLSGMEATRAARRGTLSLSPENFMLHTTSLFFLRDIVELSKLGHPSPFE
jgi:hypothetical protein